MENTLSVVRPGWDGIGMGRTTTVSHVLGGGRIWVPLNCRDCTSVRSSRTMPKNNSRANFFVLHFYDRTQIPSDKRTTSTQTISSSDCARHLKTVDIMYTFGISPPHPPFFYFWLLFSSFLLHSPSPSSPSTPAASASSPAPPKEKEPKKEAELVARDTHALTKRVKIAKKPKNTLFWQTKYLCCYANPYFMYSSLTFCLPVLFCLKRHIRSLK